MGGDWLEGGEIGGVRLRKVYLSLYNIGFQNTKVNSLVCFDFSLL